MNMHYGSTCLYLIEKKQKKEQQYREETKKQIKTKIGTATLLSSFTCNFFVIYVIQNRHLYNYQYQ